MSPKKEKKSENQIELYGVFGIPGSAVVFFYFYFSALKKRLKRKNRFLITSQKRGSEYF